MATFKNSSVDDDLRAINEYFHRVAPVTPAAKKLFNEWVSWWEQNVANAWFLTQADLDHARNLRNDFNRANAVTPEAKAKVEEVITTGITVEQQRGETDRRNTEGGFTEPPPGAARKWWFWPAVASVATAAVVVVVPKVIKTYLGMR